MRPIVRDVTFVVDNASPTTYSRDEFRKLMERTRSGQVVDDQGSVLVLCPPKSHPDAKAGRYVSDPLACYIKHGERRALDEDQLFDDICP